MDEMILVRHDVLLFNSFFDKRSLLSIFFVAKTQVEILMQTTIIKSWLLLLMMARIT